MNLDAKIPAVNEILVVQGNVAILCVTILRQIAVAER
jgi:hypothetical protein